MLVSVKVFSWLVLGAGRDWRGPELGVKGTRKLPHTATSPQSQRGAILVKPGSDVTVRMVLNKQGSGRTIYISCLL